MQTNKNTKRYYWIKLFDYVVDGDIFDYMMSLENGSTVFTIYIKLLHLVINRNGIFKTTIHVIEFVDSVEKITRDLKHFKYADVLFTLGFLESVGLMGRANDKAYFFNNYENFVGSETKAAQRKRNQRKKIEQKETIKSVDNLLDNVPKKAGQCLDNVTQEIREESIEKKSKEIKSLETRGGDDLIESPPSASSAGELLALFKKINPNLSSPDKLSAEHRLAVDTLLDKGYSYQKIETVFQVVKENAFLNGSIDKPNWNGATFEFVINVRNFEKILAGQYVQPGESSQQNYAPPQVTSHDPMDDDIQERLREKYAQN